MKDKEKTIGKKLFLILFTAILLPAVSALLIGYYSTQTFTQTVIMVLVFSILLAILSSWAVVKYLSNFTQTIAEAFNRVKKGDLSVRLEGKDLFIMDKKNLFKKEKTEIPLDPNGNEVHKIAIGFNNTIDSFEKAIKAISNTFQQDMEMSKHIKNMGDQITVSTEDITHTITEIATATNTQTEDTESTAIQMNELSDAVQGVIAQLEDMSNFAEDTLTDSEKSSSIMKRVQSNWAESTKNFEDLSDNIQTVDRDIQNIEEILHV